MTDNEAAFLEFLDARIAQRQREIEDVPKFSSHYERLDMLLKELKAIRSKFNVILKSAAS